jgi:hypothetical protein
LTSTVIVEVDVGVDVEPIVDRHVDHRLRFFDEDPDTTRGLRTTSTMESTSYVALNVNVRVNVDVKPSTSPARPASGACERAGDLPSAVRGPPACIWWRPASVRQREREAMGGPDER